MLNICIPAQINVSAPYFTDSLKFNVLTNPLVAGMNRGKRKLMFSDC